MYDCRYTGKRPFIILWKKKLLRDNLRSVTDSKPVITRAALCWTISNLSLKDSVRGYSYIISG